MEVRERIQSDLVPEVDLVTNYEYIRTREQLKRYYDEIMYLPAWVFDTETSGTDPLVDKVSLIQIGNKDKQYVIDARYVDPSCLKDGFEDETRRKIVQHGAFDYKMMLGSFGIYVEGMRDTMIAEQVLCKSYMKYGFGLDSLALKYLKVHLDKEMQTSFINHVGPFSRRQLQYAALDCVVPDHVIYRQLQMLEREGLVQTWIIECNAISAFSDAEFRGIQLNKEKWIANINNAEKEKETATEEFLSEAVKYTGADLFGGASVNPESPSQVLPLLINAFGESDCKDRDGKLGTGDDILEKITEKHEKPKIVTSLQMIRAAAKKTASGTYGYAYLNHIHPKTDRFHPIFKQIGTETGRPSSPKPNILNIPALTEYRVPWEGGYGRKILTNDYGACELRIMASMSGDPVMCKGFNDGLDYHTFTASQFIIDKKQFLQAFIPHQKGEAGKGKWGEFLFDENGKKIPNPNFNNFVQYEFVTKKQRDVAKTINFGLAYGMGAARLAGTLGIAKSEAREYIKKFNETFAVLVAWLKENQEKTLDLRSCSYQEYQRAMREGRDPIPDLGYAETYLGRKRYFVLPKKPELVARAHEFTKYKIGMKKKKVTLDDGTEVDKDVPVFEWRAPGFTPLKFDPLNPWDENLPEKLKKYHQKVAAIKREGGNSPIQGGNADITKIAMYELRKWFRSVEKERNNGEYLAHVALQVYDEIVADVPDWLAEEAAQKMDQIMKEAGRRVITKVPVETDCAIADFWTKG